MDKREIVCIVCPVGCRITAVLENGGVADIKGNTCERGADYARAEIMAPMRNITTIVKVDGGDLPYVSVKTSAPIPKALMLDAVRAAGGLQPAAPVNIGDVLMKDVLGTGSDIVATLRVRAV